MTAFRKEDFDYFGGYLSYHPARGETRKFVARFKYSGRDKAGFMNFLIKNFTVEEYFAATDAGESPAKVLETKGYVSTTVKSMLKKNGYPATAEGFAAYIANESAAFRAKKSA